MAKIFEKKVENPDIRQLKLSREGASGEGDINFKGSSPIKFRDHETNEIWSFRCFKSAGQSYLGKEDWDSFVKSKGIRGGSNKIEVYEEDGFYDTDEAPRYTIKVTKL
ncbi:hypothetical protein SLE2022_040250 [Rubroshorea leprosula]